MANRLVAAVALVILAACGGGSSTAFRAPSPSPTVTPPPPRGNASVSIAIAIPGRLGSSAARAAKYVSPATQTIQTAVNGGAPQTFAVSGGTPCSDPSAATPPPPPASGTCTLYTVTAPIGLDTFAFTLLDGANHVLSQGSVQQTIVADTTNTVSVTFDGVAAALRISLSDPAPPSGAAARDVIVLLPLDAGGYTIIGAPGGLPPITVTDGDGTGATALYLAGSDNTCATSSGSPSSSVTTTMRTINNISQYTNVCVAYTGQALPNGATFTATLSGGPSATATLMPSAPLGPAASGAWVLGNNRANGTTDTTPRLKRFDTSLNLLDEISGSNAHFVNPSGLTTDASGNVYVLEQQPILSNTTNTIDVFAPSQSGNVAPLATTTFPKTETQGDIFYGKLISVALDGAGNAYFLDAQVSTQCTIYRVPVTGGTSTVAPVGDCHHIIHPDPYNDIVEMKYDIPRSRLYISATTHTSLISFVAIARYDRQPDGTFALFGEIKYQQSGGGGFALDRTGNILIHANGSSASPLALLPASGFVAGQSTSPAALDMYPGYGAVTIDPSGNIFADAFDANFISTGIEIIPSGSHTPSATNSFIGYMMAPVTNVSSSSSAIAVFPPAVETQSSAPINVSENGYNGPFNQTNDCGGLATVTPANANGPNATFTVMSLHKAGGTCRVNVFDTNQHAVTVPVGITNIVITGSSKRRRP